MIGAPLARCALTPRSAQRGLSRGCSATPEAAALAEEGERLLVFTDGDASAREVRIAKVRAASRAAALTGTRFSPLQHSQLLGAEREQRLEHAPSRRSSSSRTRRRRGGLADHGQSAVSSPSPGRRPSRGRPADSFTSPLMRTSLPLYLDEFCSSSMGVTDAQPASRNERLAQAVRPDDPGKVKGGRKAWQRLRGEDLEGNGNEANLPEARFQRPVRRSQSVVFMVGPEPALHFRSMNPWRAYSGRKRGVGQRNTVSVPRSGAEGQCRLQQRRSQAEGFVRRAARRKPVT